MFSNSSTVVTDYLVPIGKSLVRVWIDKVQGALGIVPCAIRRMANPNDFEIELADSSIRTSLAVNK